MVHPARPQDVLSLLTGLRQSRAFLDKPVPRSIVDDLLQVARWTGSAKNRQPWEFIVIDDRDTNNALAGAGDFTEFLANVPLSIVIVLDNTQPRSEAYDEGRVSERLMLAAGSCGLGSGTAWFSSEEAQNRVRDILGVPVGKIVWSAVGLGYADPSRAQRSSTLQAGRKSLDEIVSYGRYGNRDVPGE